MVYKSFYIRIIIRVLLIFITGFIFLRIIDLPNLLYAKFSLIVLTIFQLGSLLFYLNRINRKLAMFFESVKTEDYNVVFKNPEKDSDYDELNIQLDQLSKHFKEVIIKREEQDEYFRAVIEHIGIGIFAFNEKGSIKFINSEALKIFGLAHLKNINALDYAHKNLSAFFQNLVPSQQQLLELKRDNETLQLAAKVTLYKIAEDELNLVSLQNIKPELDLKETETWQKMIRILTHEIMNSMSPITSLANSLSTLIQKNPEPDEKTRSKLYKGLSTIKNRGEGMMDFIRKYRNLTILPLPQTTDILLDKLMNELSILFRESFDKDQINFKCSIEPKDLILKADQEQIEQVLINLIKNSIWATKDQTTKNISINIFKSLARVHIEVSDNGRGFSTELNDKIFIPFFTTNKEGSGIGLSLSRQIMLMHGGSISAHSKEGQGAIFVLIFN